MNYLYTSFMLALWLILQWLTHDSYWFNFTVNLIYVTVSANSIFVYYEKSKQKNIERPKLHFTRKEWETAFKAAQEKLKISLKNER